MKQAGAEPPSNVGIRDVLAPNLTAVFCGFNPGLRSGATGHHYAGANNRFWDLLYDTGLVARRLDPAEDRLVLVHGFGLTNIVSRTTASASDLRRADYRTGAAELRTRVAAVRPRVMCYMGKGVYAGLLGSPSARLRFGPQPRGTFPGTLDFVAHSPSGRAAVPYRDKLAMLHELAALLRAEEASARQQSALEMARNILHSHLALRPGEMVVILHTGGQSGLLDALGRSAAAAAQRLVAHDVSVSGPVTWPPGCPVLAVRPPTDHPTGKSMDQLLAALCQQAGSESVLVLPNLPGESLSRLYSAPAAEIERLGADRARELPIGRGLRLRSTSGTDLRFAVSGPTVSQAASRLPVATVPGLLRMAVVPGSASGQVVVDAGLSCGLNTEDVSLSFSEGQLTQWRRSGRPAGSKACPDSVVDRFIAQLRGGDGSGFHLEQLVLGVNPAARPSGAHHEDQAVAGRVSVELTGGVTGILADGQVRVVRRRAPGVEA